MNNLDRQINHYLPLLRTVLNSDTSKYFFTNNELHIALIAKGDLCTANKIYVSEILYRLHASSLITFRRNLFWIEAINQARVEGSYFSFCTSMRAFIESSADSFYSLRYVPQNLATNYRIIKKCVLGIKREKIHLFKELEDWGIHFLEAGKYENQEMPKEHFKAKSTWEYLKSIDSESVLKPVYPMYQELCQISHPSRESTYLFFREKDNYWSVKDVNQKDLISDFISKYNEEYAEIFQKCLNSSLLTLWLIDKFKVDDISTPFIKEIDFSDIGDFKKLNKLISASIKEKNKENRTIFSSGAQKAGAR